MKLPMIVLALTTLSGFIATTASAVRAENTPEYVLANPPAEVPSPSLFILDHSSAAPASSFR